MNPSPSKEENSILLEISSPRNKSFVIDSIYSFITEIMDEQKFNSDYE